MVRARGRSARDLSDASDLREVCEGGRAGPVVFATRRASSPRLAPRSSARRPSRWPQARRPVQRTTDPKAAAVEDVRVDHGRAHVAMTEQLLDELTRLRVQVATRRREDPLPGPLVSCVRVLHAQGARHLDPAGTWVEIGLVRDAPSCQVGTQGLDERPGQSWRPLGSAPRTATSSDGRSASGTGKAGATAAILPNVTATSRHASVSRIVMVLV